MARVAARVLLAVVDHEVPGRIVLMQAGPTPYRLTTPATQAPR